MKPGNVPASFVLAVPDDALAPDTPKGSLLMFAEGRPSSFGTGVLVEDESGRRYVRRYIEGPGGTWIAAARNDSYVTLHSERDRLVILAHVKWRLSGEV